ncbi:hypothetical protein BDZ97DRAFT_938130 [Flammula alnicola]|nr:hypothetical protein BDZ97DRAFT_938130 [Flammula alnicola]
MYSPQCSHKTKDDKILRCPKFHPPRVSLEHRAAGPTWMMGWIGSQIFAMHWRWIENVSRVIISVHKSGPTTRRPPNGRGPFSHMLLAPFLSQELLQIKRPLERDRLDVPPAEEKPETVVLACP